MRSFAGLTEMGSAHRPDVGTPIVRSCALTVLPGQALTFEQGLEVSGLRAALAQDTADLKAAGAAYVVTFTVSIQEIARP